MTNTNICVQSTTDYNGIKNISGNRIINPRNVELIKVAMNKKQLIVPAILNEKMEIIDGAHRFTACKQLGLPFYYIIVDGYTLDEVQVINANMKNWVLEDFLDSFVSLYKLGNSDYTNYATLKDFIKETGLPLASALRISDFRSSKADIEFAFKHGAFRFVNYDKSLEYAIDLRDFEKYDMKKWCSSSFITAYMPLYFSIKVEHAKMANNVPNSLAKFREASGAKVLGQMLVDVYNFRRPRKDKIDLNPVVNEWIDNKIFR